MTLKQFYGYTQDEAIQQAQEQYGDNFVVLKITEPTQEGGLVRVSIILEPQSTPPEVPQESRSTSTTTTTSTSTSAASSATSTSSSLSKLRQIAMGMEPALSEKLQPKKPLPTFKPEVATEIEQHTRQDNDRLEALEHLFKASLSNYELEYAQHPVFKQLVASGVPVKTVMQWFLTIGDDSLQSDRDELFMMKRISQLIVHAVGQASTSLHGKQNVYFGSSSAGKTSLIMQLAREFISQHAGDADRLQEIGLCTLKPTRSNEPYYTILEAFALDLGIEYRKVSSQQEFDALQLQWQTKELVLFDTPSIQRTHSNSIEEFKEIQTWMTTHPSIDRHWVQNALDCVTPVVPTQWINTELKPHYLCFTHLDMVDKWGPMLVFMKQLPTHTRLLRTNSNGAEQLREFNPRWFVGKLLNQV
jgi:flagellar biosynthesis GTPase FlhF